VKFLLTAHGSLADFITNQQIADEARRRLHRGAWDQIAGGSESETTLRRNRQAFERIAFRPRVLVDVSHIDPSTTFLGHRLRIPVLLAPIGSLQSFHADGTLTLVRAATAFGVVPVISIGSETALEETASATPAPKMFQLYIHGDAVWIQSVLERVERAGYAALVVTVDAAHRSRREGAMLSGYLSPGRLSAVEREFKAGATWQTVAAIRERWQGPLLLKGLHTAADAELAVQHGVDVVWVSNHGGRQLDHALGSLEVLPEIASAVSGRARIVFDGGVQRGGDILKALALGANVVALGKLQGWALAAGGADGVVRMLEILEDEITSTMGLLGITSVCEMSLANIRAAEPARTADTISWERSRTVARGQ
jgi:isopentenyl diphosphate isomerase/L-lactate dehydrogenase-like FMN-dependent dehydrogenase